MEPPLGQNFFLTIQLRHPVSCPAAVWICNERIRSTMTTEKCQCIWSSACPATHQGTRSQPALSANHGWKFENGKEIPRKITFSNDPLSLPEMGGPNHPPLGDIHNLQRCRAASMLCWRLPHSVGAVPWPPHTFRQVSTCLSCLTNRHDNRYYNVDTHTEVCVCILYIYIIYLCVCMCVRVYSVIEHQIPCQPVRDCTQTKIQAIQATKRVSQWFPHVPMACSSYFQDEEHLQNFSCPTPRPPTTSSNSCIEAWAGPGNKAPRCRLTVFVSLEVLQ